MTNITKAVTPSTSASSNTKIYTKVMTKKPKNEKKKQTLQFRKRSMVDQGRLTIKAPKLRETPSKMAIKGNESIRFCLKLQK